MAVELKSSFTPGRDLATDLPGGQAPSPYGNLPPAIMELLLARTQQRAQAAPRAMAQAQAPAPVIMPRMGAAPTSDDRPRVITRMREVPQNPYDAMSRIPGGLGGTGHTNTVKRERGFVGKDGRIQWEFDGLDSMNPSGHGGVFGGGGAAPGPTENLQEEMPAYRTGSPSSGFDARTGMIPPQEQPVAAAAQGQHMPRRQARGAY